MLRKLRAIFCIALLMCTLSMGTLFVGTVSANEPLPTQQRRIEIAYEDDLIIVYNSYGSSAGDFSYIYHKATGTYTVL